MATRSAKITAVRFREAGTAGAKTAVSGDLIAASTTGPDPNVPTKRMVTGIEQRIGFRYGFSIDIDDTALLAAYVALHTAAAGQTGTPTSEPLAWTAQGAIQSGSAAFTPIVESSAGLVDSYIRTRYEAALELKDIAQYGSLAALDKTRIDIALERTDGTYLIFHNVYIQTIFNPTYGAERNQTVRVIFSGEERNADTVVEDPATAVWAALNTLQLADKRLELEIDFEGGSANSANGGSTVVIASAGFSVVPRLPVGQEDFEGITLAGNGFATTLGGVLTVTPVLP